MGDHAQVEQGQAPVVEQQHVARVRVGMDQAVHEHLVEVGLHQRIGPRAQVQLETRHVGHLGDLGAVEQVHHQHARGAHPTHGLGDADVGEVAQVVGEGLEVVGLEPVVELAEQGLAELARPLGEVVAAADVAEAVDGAGQLGDQVQVGADGAEDVGTLHLHRHPAPATQGGRMHLRQRGGGQRLGVEALERL